MAIVKAVRLDVEGKPIEEQDVLNVYDTTYHFYERFYTKDGFCVRFEVLEGTEAGQDAFMRSYPALLDIGIMGRCVCANRCNVDCYQNAKNRHEANMTVANYRRIMEESKNKVFQVALGGAGDPDTHENFEDILKITREYGITPSYTTSGIAMTPEKARLSKEYCGAVAVSEHNAEYTKRAVEMLIEAGVPTYLHYVLSRESIAEAVERLKKKKFYDNLTAVTFLLYKPIGLGQAEKVLKRDTPKFQEFVDLIATAGGMPFRIGMDSCSSPMLIGLKSIPKEYYDTCESGRFSMYISSDMKAMPCSFCNQDKSWGVDLTTCTIEQAWSGEVFNSFRKSLKTSCISCSDRGQCMGGCPLCSDIVLCDRPCKDKK